MKDTLDDVFKKHCIISTHKTCKGCPESRLWNQDGDLFAFKGDILSLPDRQSDTCLNCSTGKLFFSTIYGTCSFTRDFCNRTGPCDESCPIYDKDAPSWMKKVIL